ncbi:MAG: TIGR03618 family F420-dependent PPOX class oxidoreductase [Streptosporangiaceae bacterium]
MDLDDLDRVAAADSYLAVVATTRADGSVQASVVNAGLLDHPTTGERVAAFVTYGRVKKANLRERPRATLVWRAGWQWAAVEGTVELAGPDDPLPGLSGDGVQRLLRDVFVAAGGSHDDWPAYDEAMARERRAAVLVSPERVYSNTR